MSAIDKEPFPKGALIGIAGLLAISLVAAAAGRIAGVAKAQAPVANLEHSRAQVALRFVDHPDGSVVVLYAATGAKAARIAPGEGGFVRGVMRGLAHERIRRGVGQDAAFSLALDANGALWLTDPATRRQIDLDAFGIDNRSSFAALLPPGGRISS
jgi:putative photosynthetic complex assembly protein